MTDLKPHKKRKTRMVLAVAAGLALAAAHPHWSLAGLGWIAPGLMLVTAMGMDGRDAFRLGYVAGLAFHLASLYWLLYIPVKFAPILGWILLSSFLALYQGAWVWLCWKVYPAPKTAGGMPTLWEQFQVNRWPAQLGWTLTCAALWVLMEMTQARLFTGFPWNLLAASQYRLTPIVQMASVTGIYGISFLMVWFSVSLMSAGAGMIYRPAQARDWMIDLLPPLFVVVIVAGLGMRRVYYTPEPPARMKIGLVQPSIPQTAIWDPAESGRRFDKLIELSRQALAEDLDLLVWPEASLPSLFRYDTNVQVVVTNMVRRHKTWLAFGAEDLSWKDQPAGNKKYDYFNSAMLLDPAGKLLRIYKKHKLVMFGEYVPLADWIPFLRDFTSVQGDFTPGRQVVPFDLEDLKVRIGVLICFEDVFPHVVRRYVWPDTDFLLNLTNNGWFGESAAQWQHAAAAVFRAVENGLPLVRCANNGLSCWVDSRGRLHDVYFPGTRDIYGEGIKIVSVPILADQARVTTWYRRYGDWFGWMCVVWSAAALVRRKFKRF